MSDLPKVASGKVLVTYRSHDNMAYPAKLVSTRYGEEHTTMWLVNGRSWDFYSITLAKLYVDITPEKRYSVWSKKAGRFVGLGESLILPFGTKMDAELAIDTFCRKTGMLSSNYAVVEYDFPGE